MDIPSIILSKYNQIFLILLVAYKEYGVGLNKSHNAYMYIIQAVMFNSIWPLSDISDRFVGDRLMVVPKSENIIMVVEDESSTRGYITAMITQYNYRYRGFNNAEDAWDDYRRNRQRYICAVVDVFLPGGMDGLTLVKKIQEVNEGFPVLFSTGITDPDNVAILRQHGDYIAKEWYPHKGWFAIQDLILKAG